MMYKLKSGLALILTLIASQTFALSAEKAPESQGLATNPLFLSMGLLAVTLLLVIIILANVLKSSLRSKLKEIMSSKTLILILCFTPLSSLFAEGEKATAMGFNEAIPIGGLHPVAFYSLFAVLLLEIFVILWLCLLIMRTIARQELASEKAEGKLHKKSAFSKFFSGKVLGVIPIEQEADIMLDHDYDGIKELDNDLPPWWKYGFYMTIVSAVIYLVGYHITNTFKLSEDEYKDQIAEAELQKQAYRNKMAMNVDENNASFLSDAASIDKGKGIFAQKCVTCHGEKAEGKVGPNLTDDYWLYGGSAGNVFKTVKFGTTKGMQPWKDALSPVDIQNVISFIHALKGSKPAGALAPQGQLYQEADTISDTAAAPAQNEQSMEVRN